MDGFIGILLNGSEVDKFIPPDTFMFYLQVSVLETSVWMYCYSSQIMIPQLRIKYEKAKLSPSCDDCACYIIYYCILTGSCFLLRGYFFIVHLILDFINF